jgi:hypothetical protein
MMTFRPSHPLGPGTLHHGLGQCRRRLCGVAQAATFVPQTVSPAATLKLVLQGIVTRVPEIYSYVRAFSVRLQVPVEME